MVINNDLFEEWLIALEKNGHPVLPLVLLILSLLAHLIVAILPFGLYLLGVLVARKSGETGSREGARITALFPVPVALIAASCRAIPVTYALWPKHKGWYAGIDCTEWVSYSFPFFSEPRYIPAEIAFCLDHLATLWYVPLAACILSFLLGIRRFRGVSTALICLSVQLLFSLFVYWIYGMYLAFVLFPSIVGILIIVVGGFFGLAALIGGAKDAVSPDYRTAKLDDGTILTKNDGMFGDGWKDEKGNKWKQNGSKFEKQ